jgi:hypothetical protein
MKNKGLQFQYIGGIGLDDIPSLMETGFTAFVSGLITQSKNKKDQTTKMPLMEPSIFKIGDKILESRLFFRNGKIWF